MDKRAFKMKATFTWICEQEVHAFDENDAFFQFEEMMIDEINYAANNSIHKHTEYEEVEEISKEILRQRSYYNCEKDVA